MKKKVAVIFGGRSVEHEVSVISGLQVLENIDESKYTAVPLYINKEGKWFTGDSLRKFKNYKENNLNDLKEIVVVPTNNDYNLYRVLMLLFQLSMEQTEKTEQFREFLN